MSYKVLIDGVEYPVISISGRVKDADWDYRYSKHIKLDMPVSDIFNIFRDGLIWSIVEYETVSNNYVDENGNDMMEEHEERTEYDNSDFCVLGDIAIHNDGTCTVAMGKPTEAERMQEQLANTVTGEELAAAYNEGVNSL